jgi:hypothetical protein
MPTVFTPEMDERIKEIYTPPYVRGLVVQQARAWGIKTEYVTHRARALGFNPLSWSIASKKWSAEEVRLLRSVPHKNSREASQYLKRKGYRRTPDACSTFRLRDGWKASKERDPTDIGYSAKAVAELIGVEPGTILRFIRLGYISAKRDMQEQGVAHRISQKSLYEFMVNHVHRWEPAKADKYWLIDFLTNYRAMN